MNPNLQAGNYAAVMVIPGIGNLTKEHRLLQDMFQLLMSYGIEKRSAEIICDNTVLTEMFSRGLTSVKDAKRALTEIARITGNSKAKRIKSFLCSEQDSNLHNHSVTTP